MSGRKVELDEVIMHSLELENSTSEKSVLVMPTPTREEANDDDHETLVQRGAIQMVFNPFLRWRFKLSPSE